MNIQFTQGDTVAIPEGCTAIIKDGIITFTPLQEFKDGDILAAEGWNKACPFIYAGEDDKGCHKFYAGVNCGGGLVISDGYDRWGKNTLRLATEEEKQELFDLMKEKGLRWNTAKKRVEEIRWRANDKRAYYFISEQGYVMVNYEAGFPSDEDKWVFGNYFRTEEQAEAAAEAIKEVLRKFHEEND